MAQAPKVKFSDIYLDETSQNRHRYLVIGGLIVHRECVEQLNNSIAQARLPELPYGELKWGKVSKTKLSAYKKVVDTFFDSHPECLPLEFHSIAIHTPDIKDKYFNSGSREIGFNKEVYQLSMKFGRLYKTSYFNVYPDQRTTKSSVEEL
jgi:hypothetical protein